MLLRWLTIVMIFAMLIAAMDWTIERIAQMRDRLGLSRAEFARLLGVDARTVYRWEAGESSPTGPAEAVLLGIDQALKAPSDGLTSALSAIGAMAAIGGLGFMIYKLIELLAQHEGES